MAEKRKGLRQLRIEIADHDNPAHRVAMNGEGVWLKPVNGKKGGNNPWRFLAWDELAKIAASVPGIEPEGDAE